MKTKFNMITILSIVVCIIIAIISLPHLNIILLSLSPTSEYLSFLINNGILTKYVLNTLELILKVGLFSSIIGFLGAYFITFYDFKFKKIINLLFILPLSIPIYLGAYVYSDIYLTFPTLKLIFKNDFTMNSSVFIYVIFLYPYIYLSTYTYLKNHMQEYIEAGQVLKLSNFAILKRIIFPLSKTVVFSASLFVIYESLSDFAVSEYYGIHTLSRAFNDAWRVSSDQSTSAKLALSLLIIIGFIIALEKLLRRRIKLDSSKMAKSKLIKTSTSMKTFIYSFYLVIICLGFILPFQKIMSSAIKNYNYFFERNIINVTLDTFKISLYVIIVIVIVGMFLSSMKKYLSNKINKPISIIVNLGYMMPSMILSLGVYSILFKLDGLINPITSTLISKKYIITSTIIILVVGLSLKFLSIAFNNFEQTYKKTNNSIFEASLMLGQNPIKTFFRVDLYFLSKTSIVIIILVILDVFKELTLSFSLSPFNFRTVSMEIYHYMANEMQQIAYVPGSIITFICIICILILERGLVNEK